MTTFTLNGDEKPWRAQSLDRLLVDIGVRSDRAGIAVALNDAVVPRGDWATTPIEPRDRVEIIHIVKGG